MMSHTAEALFILPPLHSTDIEETLATLQDLSRHLVRRDEALRRNRLRVVLEQLRRRMLQGLWSDRTIAWTHDRMCAQKRGRIPDRLQGRIQDKITSLSGVIRARVLRLAITAAPRITEMTAGIRMPVQIEHLQARQAHCQ
jgi:hypothetical protein